MVAVMNDSSRAARTKPGMVLNRPKLDELRKAHNIPSDAELARILKCDPVTLWRASKGTPVSAIFIAQLTLAFPHVPTGDVFYAVDADAVAA
jgi:hypothetical protein